MFERGQYLMLMLGCALLTLPLEFVFGARVWRQPKRLLLAIVPGLLVFVAWDIWATHRGTWGFSERYTVGLTLPGGVVVEELLFFAVIPICALLTLESVRNVLTGDTPLQQWLRAR